MRIVLSALLLLASHLTLAQAARDVLLGANMDLIKSNNDGYFERVQAGLEANYFFVKHLSATGGLEVWTRDGVSAVAGMRWYPGKDAYIRGRALLGSMKDVSVGGGWAKPMTEVLRFEAMADFYFQGTFTIRAGLAILVR
jgi:hypothetical protein